MSSGSFVVSLDMELMWGVRDHATKEQYGHRVLGEREAIPAMLDLFEKNGIHASWAVVGMAMCDGRDELLARAPEERPTYARPHLSNYAYIDETGDSERKDPYYFAPSMIRRIAACPGQEIGTHTFSHYYCLEPGQTPDQFAADLAAARTQLLEWQSDCRSIVFPRNQYLPEHLRVCADAGIAVFRGTEPSWFYGTDPGGQGPLRRLGRLADSYLPLTGDNFADPVREGPVVNVPSTRMLRAHNPRLKRLEGVRYRRIARAMTAAAKRGASFHLWWHPHNFGGETAENIAFLDRVIGHFGRLRDEYGMRSRNMAEAGAAG